jgi:hypothetical protein
MLRRECDNFAMQSCASRLHMDDVACSISPTATTAAAWRELLAEAQAIFANSSLPDGWN